METAAGSSLRQDDIIESGQRIPRQACSKPLMKGTTLEGRRRTMKKQFVVIAFAAATTAATFSAEAEAKGLRLGGAGGTLAAFALGAALARSTQPTYARPAPVYREYREPRYVEREQPRRVVKKDDDDDKPKKVVRSKKDDDDDDDKPSRRVASKPAPKAEPAPVRFAFDGKGRMFDPVQQAWFDGKGQCWKGDAGWAFVDGKWEYGKSQWSEVNGFWKASSGSQPQTVECATITAFAPKVAPVQTAAIPAPVTAAPAATAPNAPQTAIPATAQSAQKVADSKPVASSVTTSIQDLPNAGKSASSSSPLECRKFLPSTGTTVSVPCTE